MKLYEQIKLFSGKYFRWIWIAFFFNCIPIWKTFLIILVYGTKSHPDFHHYNQKFSGIRQKLQIE